MEKFDNILSRVTLIAAFLVAALVCADEFGASDAFRVAAAIPLTIAAIIVAVRKRQFTIAALAILAPWIDIVLMLFAFTLFGFSFGMGP
ncbi:hypothetical protein WG915_06690 [Corynebacterium sp. H128]|uniref:hypothetical protein n=1 Tax=unclassified Corynebacterium TaxID=2624378 RepID=UPI0030A554F6